MIVRQFYLDCLSQASYLVGDESSGRAIVVDPRRDVGDYLKAAAEDALSIELTILTHVHADFVPGYAELLEATGAPVAMGELAPVKFPVRRLVDHERLLLGDATSGVAIDIVATPGHTVESITLAIFEHASDPDPCALLTGDTLFVGDVGRPDLLAASGTSAREMARTLYRSLRQRILPLPDHVVIYPGHGGGSACGKALSKETFSTLGSQRRTNAALREMSEEEFVELSIDGLVDPPSYFTETTARNRSGHEPVAPLPLEALDLDDVEAGAAWGVLVLDVRDPHVFSFAHVRGSVNVGLEGRFAELAAAVYRPGQAVALVGSVEEVAEARVRLGRVGLDDVLGALYDPEPLLSRSSARTASASRVSATEAARLIATNPALQVVDVREPGELEDGTLPRAINIRCSQLRAGLAQLDPCRPVLVYCAGGYRSSAAASFLRVSGFADVTDVLEGYAAWNALLAREELSA